MTIQKTAIIRSSVTEHYLRLGRRQQRNWAVANISLPHCRQFVNLGNRLDREALAESAPRVFQHIYALLKERLSVKATARATVSGQTRIMIELEGKAAVYVTFSDTDLKLEGYARDKKVLAEIRHLFNDLKLSLNRDADIGKMSDLLLGAKRLGRAKVAKIIGELADDRFLPILRQQLRLDKSATVRREALKALGQMNYRGRKTDLQLGLEDSDEAVHVMASAFLKGNSFTAEEPLLSFPAKERPNGEFDRVAGALLGLAMGDMMGRPLEFLQRANIAEQFGHPVRDLMVSTNPQIRFGQTSDDTQLMIMTAEAIDPERGFLPALFAGSLAEHAFQIDVNGIPNHGYGAATMRAARYLYYGIPWAQSGVDASTCGPALRVSPLAVHYHNDLDTLREAVLTASPITHKAAPAIAGALAVAFGVARLLTFDRSSEPAELVSWLNGWFRRYDEELADRLDLAARLALDGHLPVEMAYDILGNSSESVETVPAAFYAFLRTPLDFRATILTAINAGGDADSIGAIAGTLSGAYNGASSIPRDWLGYMREPSLVYGAIRRLTDR